MSKADAIIKWFMPKEERFHELLGRGAVNLGEAAKAFASLAHTEDFAVRKGHTQRLREIEKTGDGITREIFDALNSTFITPFDREDIRSIAVDMDDILDFLEAAANSLILFELSEAPEPLRQFADILVDMVTEVSKITDLVWDAKNQARIHEAIVRVSDLENRADDLFNRVIAELFRGDSSRAIEILKWKEVYQVLEDGCDACKDYTHIIGNVLVKNA
ncbi:MAG TPA: DUF47 family protein [Thermoanaerobaculia bacterium]|jgi:predicted phosphate transport protein (TIGR00153 family)|nr:DUF47 family protein [Thermoanaerobaculia bacterium]